MCKFVLYDVCHLFILLTPTNMVPLKGCTDPVDPSTRIANTTCEKKGYDKRKHEEDVCRRTDNHSAPVRGPEIVAGGNVEG